MRRRLGLLVAVLLAVAGCGGDSRPAPRERATPTPTAAPASAAGVPASAGHGWDLLGTTSDWSPLAATVAAFIRRHAASAG